MPVGSIAVRHLVAEARHEDELVARILGVRAAAEEGASLKIVAGENASAATRGKSNGSRPKEETIRRDRPTDQ
jgi:hypothetical protein